MTSHQVETRTALLGETRITLLGTEPRPGEELLAEFDIPPAWRAVRSLRSDDLRHGWVVLTTLPNIHTNACSSQILNLEGGVSRFKSAPRLFHVSADEESRWKEVGEHHSNLRSPGYTLHGADSCREAFTLAFGVAVSGERRIAHGLFALHDGIFTHVEIPYDQMTTPPVKPFLRHLRRAMEMNETNPD